MATAKEMLARGLAGANGSKGPAKVEAQPKKPPAPRPIVPWHPLPLEHLPGPLRELSYEAGVALGCDPSYVALPGLSALSAAIGNTRGVHIKKTWKELPILWCVVVGDSGTLKTPAFKVALAPIWAAEEGWKDSHADEGEQAQKKPARRASCSDITVEKLAEMLEDNQRGLLVARDELAGWFGSFMKYKAAGAGSDVPNWLEMYQGGVLRVDRKTGDRKSLFVRRACVSVVGGIQPATLARALREEFFECGLVARLLLASPPKMRKRWTEAEVPDIVLKRWDDTVNAMLNFVPDKDSRDKPAPYYVRLSPPAYEMWVAWFREWAVKQDAAEGEAAACYSKIEAVAARIALIHHCATLRDEDTKHPLGPESMEAGVALAKWFAREALRNYASVKASDEEKMMVRLVEWARRQGDKATVRNLHRANQGRFQTSDAARDALQQLVDQGFGEWEKEQTGGHPAERFILKMTKDVCDKSDASDKRFDEEDEEH